MGGGHSPTDTAYTSTIQKNKRILFYLFFLWFLPRRKEDRVRVLQNRVLTKIFGPKREEVTAGQRKLHMKSFIICILRQTNSTWTARVVHVEKMTDGHRTLV
ncbi:hypothetical protein L798_12621 [Zootermopsis nevadensis]|uniref:Uncharacterized protein n=1 Tax=Zootermopsis nevadensis TaxID=136037 RepID=A0A067QU46_ZOONE|nr:hypothetical protein L798_12621 [Zootermopsis nevadensis]